MEVNAGWYDDPWNESDLRWWDGREWTGRTATTGPAAGVVGNRAALANTGIGHLIGRDGRIAVVDVETTGLYNTDRVVEIAILTLDCDGRIHDEFETLIQPMRDVGPTWLHGIDAVMLRGAPSFAEVAHHVASRLDGAVVVGHNVRFDMRMLGNELAAAGIDIDWGSAIDTLRATGCKLGQACMEHGVLLEDAHRAIADARATARLLFATSDRYVEACQPAVARPLQVTPLRVYAREGHIEVLPPAPYLAALAGGLHSSPDVAPYVQLLDTAIADLRLTADERTALRSLAEELGLDELEIARAHREFMNGLIDAAVEDGVVTDDEHDHLCRAAALLGVDMDAVMVRIEPFRAMVGDMDLLPGMSVCFTGQGELGGVLIDRKTQEGMAQEHGLIVAKSVTKKGPDLVVAADGDSRSTKARRARELGIAICSFSEFASALESGGPVPSARAASTGAVMVCVTCGSSWMAPRKVLTSVCVDCSRATLLGPKPMRTETAGFQSVSQSAWDAATLVALVCAACGINWERPRTRGRRPATCPDCAKEQMA
ncbi:exonuclease domain-containing protein [Mycobacterium sp. URHB0021]